MTPDRSHFLPLDLPADKWGAYYESHRIIVDGLRGAIGSMNFALFSALVCRKNQLDGDRCNLRFPINPFLKNASQAVFASPTSRGRA